MSPMKVINNWQRHWTKQNSNRTLTRNNNNNNNNNNNKIFMTKMLLTRIGKMEVMMTITIIMMHAHHLIMKCYNDTSQMCYVLMKTLTIHRSKIRTTHAWIWQVNRQKSNKSMFKMHRMFMQCKHFNKISKVNNITVSNANYNDNNNNNNNNSCAWCMQWMQTQTQTQTQIWCVLITIILIWIITCSPITWITWTTCRSRTHSLFCHEMDQIVKCSLCLTLLLILCNLSLTPINIFSMLGTRQRGSNS